MTDWTETEYYRRRALEERAVADLAAAASVRAVHDELALRYELIVARSEMSPAD